jgi:hypothetical protein
MEDVRIYQIQVRGQVTTSEIESFSPPGLTLEPGNEDCSILTVRTDQSGLVGLIRQLHGLGFELLSFRCISVLI